MRSRYGHVTHAGAIRGAPKPSELVHGADEDGAKINVSPTVDAAMAKLADAFRLAKHTCGHRPAVVVPVTCGHSDALIVFFWGTHESGVRVPLLVTRVKDDAGTPVQLQTSLDVKVTLRARLPQKRDLRGRLSVLTAAAHKA